MDDLVVIILTLAIAAIGIIGQSKRRKAASQSQQPATGKSPQSFWDILESQMEPEVQNSEPEPELELEDELIDVIPPTTGYQFKAENEGKSKVREEYTKNTSLAEIRRTKKGKISTKESSYL